MEARSNTLLYLHIGCDWLSGVRSSDVNISLSAGNSRAHDSCHLHELMLASFFAVQEKLCHKFECYICEKLLFTGAEASTVSHSHGVQVSVPGLPAT